MKLEAKEISLTIIALKDAIASMKGYNEEFPESMLVDCYKERIADMEELLQKLVG